MRNLCRSCAPPYVNYGKLLVLLISKFWWPPTDILLNYTDKRKMFKISSFLSCTKRHVFVHFFSIISINWQCLSHTQSFCWFFKLLLVYYLQILICNSWGSGTDMNTVRTNVFFLEEPALVSSHYICTCTSRISLHSHRKYLVHRQLFSRNLTQLVNVCSCENPFSVTFESLADNF